MVDTSSFQKLSFFIKISVMIMMELVGKNRKKERNQFIGTMKKNDFYRKTDFVSLTKTANFD